MNPETCEVSELASITEGDRESLFAALKEEVGAMGPDWELLPTGFDKPSRSVLRGRARASFSRTSGGKLSRYAHRRRQQRYRGR